MDIRTLTFVNLIFLFLYAAIITLNASIYGKMRGGTWFAWSNLSRGLAWLLLSASAFLPRLLSTISGDVFLVAGLICLHRSFAEVMGRGQVAWRLQIGIGVAVLSGLTYLNLVHSSAAASLILLSVSLAVQLGLTTALLFACLGAGLRGAVWFTGGILFLYALVEMTRALMLVDSPDGILRLSSGFMTLLLVGTLLANAGTAFGFLFLSAAQLRRELTRLAEHDALTGVLNRRGLRALVEQKLRAGHRAGEPVSAVMLDLDGMKMANDTWGHECGDAILCAVAKFLVASVGGQGRGRASRGR